MIQKKIKIFFSRKKANFFYLNITRKNKYRFYKQSKVNCSKIKIVLLSDSIVIYYALYNNFLYTQLASTFFP